MGSLTDALHIKAQTADHIALVLLLYMLAASYSLLFMQRKSGRNAPESATVIAETAATVGAQKD